MKLLRQKRELSGFSMIEVLVASALLSIIVMMLAMLFQQSGMAWRAGSKRAEGFMQIRGFIGSLQRDASQAIDIEGVKLHRKMLEGGDSVSFDNQKFEGGTLTFYTLSGDKRALAKITYEKSGKRTEQVLGPNGWEAGSSRNVMTTIERESSANTAKVTIENFEAHWPKDSYGNGKDGLPLFVTLGAKVISKGYTLEIGAASAGPDKQWGTRDDITTWSEK